LEGGSLNFQHPFQPCGGWSAIKLASFRQWNQAKVGDGMALLCGAAAAKGGKRTQPSHIPETSVWRSCVDRENAATLSALPSRELLCVLLFSSKPEERPPSLTPHGPRPVLSVVFQLFQPRFVAPRRQLRSVQPCATIRRLIVIGLRGEGRFHLYQTTHFGFPSRRCPQRGPSRGRDGGGARKRRALW
jgi:hypothetical protein